MRNCKWSHKSRDLSLSYGAGLRMVDLLSAIAKVVKSLLIIDSAFYVRPSLCLVQLYWNVRRWRLKSCYWTELSNIFSVDMCSTDSCLPAVIWFLVHISWPMSQPVPTSTSAFRLHRIIKFLLLSMYSYCSSMYSYRCLCILIVVYAFLDVATLTGFSALFPRL